MIDNRPIGFFDSGIGGTSIWKEVRQLLPQEHTIYLADSHNAPYGLKTKHEILSLSSKNTELLLSMNCKLIVVACNTATTNAIDELRKKYPVPFVGIEPAIKPAALHSRTHSIGVLATKGTLTSTLFTNAAQLYSDTKIIEQVGFGLVELIESGMIQSDQMTELLIKYLTPMIDADIDYLVLGCSHYPYLIPKIKKILPPHVTIIDSGEAVARQTNRILEKIGFSGASEGQSEFYTNGDINVLKQVLEGPYTITYSAF